MENICMKSIIHFQNVALHIISFSSLKSETLFWRIRKIYNSSSCFIILNRSKK